MENGRDEQGRFKKGCEGGPGRPARATERCYLVALAEEVPLERWRKIVSRAATDAEQGDVKARDFLAGYLVGENPRSLTEIAAAERRGTSADDEVNALAAQQEIDDAWARKTRILLATITPPKTPDER